MQNLDTFQRNNIMTGTQLAAEIPSSSDERRAFVVAGAYVQGLSGRKSRPSKALNVEQEHLRFWIRKYEVKKRYLEEGKEIDEPDLENAVHLRGIESIEQLERELREYLQDFSCMKVSWKVDNPLP